MTVRPDAEGQDAVDAVMAALAARLEEGARAKALAVLGKTPSAVMSRDEFVPAFIATLRTHGARTLALACLNVVREVVPTDVDLGFYRVDLLIRLGKLDTARAVLKRFARHDARPEYWQHMLALEVGADRFAATAETLDKVADTAHPAVRHAEIKALLAAEAFEQASGRIAQALDAFPDVARFHVQHVRLVLARDGARVALALARSVAQRFDEVLHAQLVLADCLRGAGESDAAQVHLETVVARFPHAALPHVRLARLTLERGQRYEALRHIQAARALDAGTLPVELAYVDVLTKLGRREEAVARLTWLVDNEQVTPAILAKLVNGLLGLHDAAKADHYMRLAAEQFPDSAALVDLLPKSDVASLRDGPKSRHDAAMARRALEALDTDAALSITREAPMARRTTQEVSMIAQALLMAGKGAMAWRYLRFCLLHWPLDPVLVSLFAQAANRIGRQRDAIAVLLSQGGDTGRRAPVVQSNLMLLHAAIGATDAAFSAFRACLSKGGFPQQNAYRLLLRAMIGDGRAAKLEGLMTAQETSGLWKQPHPQKSYHGQLVTEIKIALASGEQGPARKVGARDRMGHVALMRDHPDSNMAAMRTLRHWILFGARPDLGDGDMIPKQIVQYWDAVDPPPRIAGMMQTWETQAGFVYRRFNRATAAAYLRATGDALAMQAFRLARNPAEEADFFRLCVLAHEGGVYADADDRLVGDLNAVLPVGASFVALLEPGVANLGNNFIAAAPRHPVLVDAAQRAQAALLSRASETTWSKTGPGLLTRALAQELTCGPKQHAGAGIALLGLADLAGVVVIHNPAEHKRAKTDWRAV